MFMCSAHPHKTQCAIFRGSVASRHRQRARYIISDLSFSLCSQSLLWCSKINSIMYRDNANHTQHSSGVCPMQLISRCKIANITDQNKAHNLQNEIHPRSEGCHRSLSQLFCVSKVELAGQKYLITSWRR